MKYKYNFQKKKEELLDERVKQKVFTILTIEQRIKDEKKKGHLKNLQIMVKYSKYVASEYFPYSVWSWNHKQKFFLSKVTVIVKEKKTLRTIRVVFKLFQNAFRNKKP